MDDLVAENEIRAINKLCVGGHVNIIQVFQSGNLPFPGSSRFFIDMELCDRKLDEWITSNREVQVSQIYEYPPGFQELQIWNILSQIANGLAFIHDNDEIHRDLKPSNGTLPIPFNIWFLISYSSLQ